MAVTKATFAVREGERLTPTDRSRKLALLDRLSAATPTRATTKVDEELRDIRSARRAGWGRRSGR